MSGVGPRLKLMFVINSLGSGGAERSLAEMLPGLVSAGIQPTVVCLAHRDHGVERTVVNQGFDVRFLRARRILLRAWEIRGLIRQEKPDVLHTTIFESDLAGRLAALGSRVPVITSLVNVAYDPIRTSDPAIRPWRLRLVRMLDSWTARHLSSHFHAITHAVAEAATRWMGIPSQRITVIERGRDPGRLGNPGDERRRGVRERLGLRADDQILLNVGRQEFQKGQLDLLEALSVLAERWPNLKLLIAGRSGGASPDLARAHDRLGLGDRVRFLGYREDVPDLMAAADVFVFPSLYEGLGGALIEAMALRLPIVASELPAIKEVTEDGASALLIPPGSPRRLASAISLLLGRPELRRELGGRGRVIFDERFALERAVSRMTALYRNIATGEARIGEVAR